MGLIKRFLQFFDLGETLSKFLTLGIGNGLVIFFYNIINPLSLFDLIIINQLRPFLLMMILVISTLSFSKFYKKKNFQENVLIKFKIFPTIFYLFIKIEFFFTLNCKKGLFYIIFLELFLFPIVYFHFFDVFIFKVLALFFKYFLYTFLLFRILFDSNAFEKYQKSGIAFKKYIKIYKILQKKRMKLNRAVLQLFLLLTLSTFFKITSCGV